MQRYFSIDMTRGLIMMIMAIDHASGPWLSNVHLPEIVLKGIPDAVQFSHYHNLAHEISRVITHVCAPGFQLLAGIGLAISVCRSLAKGKSSWVVSLDMILRGVVLILIEFYVMRWPYGAGPYLFLVLCCIGSSIIFSVSCACCPRSSSCWLRWRCLPVRRSMHRRASSCPRDRIIYA